MLVCVWIITIVALSQTSHGFLLDTDCHDLDTTSCMALKKAQPDICQQGTTLSQKTCVRTCGNCPLQCYNCLTAVLDPRDCNTTIRCPTNSMCLTKVYHSSRDDHHEYIMQCEKREICQQYEGGLGRRKVSSVDRLGRSLTFECCDTDICNSPIPSRDCNNDLVFLVDESGSEGNGAFQTVLNFVKSLVTNTNVGNETSRVAMVTYSSTPTIHWYLDTYMDKQSMLNAFSTIQFSGGATQTAHALQAVDQDVLVDSRGDRPSVGNVVIVITDGQSNDHVATVKEATALHEKGATIISIGLGHRLRQDELDLMATDNNHVFAVNDPSALAGIQSQILNLLCN